MNNPKRALIECVANFSEGRDRELIYSIEDALLSHKEIILLHTDIGEDANRTVITFAGPPQAMVHAAFNAVQRATMLIDMRTQKGEHPRIGAADVIPFIPLQGITSEETALWTTELAKRIGNQLQIPVYLYGKIATTKKRSSLPFLRKGEYEQLEERMQNGLTPDFGPKTFNAKSGATVVGTRDLMLAYNINLKSKNLQAAQTIAGRIRSSGMVLNGKKIKGKLKEVQAKGWIMKAYDCAQVTTNVHNLNATPIHILYETVKEEAQAIGEEVNGSELIGLVPEKTLIEAGTFYLNRGKKNLSPVDEKQLVDIAVKKLGLDSVRPFNPDFQIIERVLKGYM